MKKFDDSHSEFTTEARKPASIVVIDANPLSLIAMAGVMDYQGYAVVCARTGEAGIEAFEMGPQDLVLCDVGDDAADALANLATMRQQKGYENLPAVLIAESQWAGLEKKAEAMEAPTRCLFKPIDPNSLIAVVHQVLYMPTLVKAHRKRGTRPSRPGWVTL
ncbi:MAG: response regulator [Pirellulaceae bacterium]